MIREAFVKCGVIGWPLLLISIALIGLIFAKLIALFFSKGIQEFHFSHKELIEPLAGVAVSLGLLGTVTGFISAFSAWASKFEPMVLISGIYEAFYTTMVGLVLSITTMISCYIFDNLSGGEKRRVRIMEEIGEVSSSEVDQYEPTPLVKDKARGSTGTAEQQSDAVQQIGDEQDFAKVEKLIKDKIANKETREAFLVAYKNADKAYKQQILNDILKDDLPVSVEAGLT